MRFIEMILKERQLFGSPGGKSRYISQILPYFPAHKTYVEPFAGGAALFFAKKPSEVEALNDADRGIANCYMALQASSWNAIQGAIDRYDWKLRTKEQWQGVGKRQRSGLMGALDFLFTIRGSFGGKQISFAPSLLGNNLRPSFAEKTVARLDGANITHGDWKPIVEQYDAPDTFFYLDPPWELEWSGPKAQFNEEDFFKTIRAMKGKFICSFRMHHVPKWVTEGLHSKIVRVRRTLMRPDQKGHGRMGEEWILSNAPFQKTDAYVHESVPAPFFSINVVEAELKKLSEKDLEKEFANLAHQLARLRTGRDSEFGTEDELMEAGDDLILEILARNRLEYGIGAKSLKQSELGLLRELLRRNVTEGPNLLPPMGELVHSGKKKMICKRMPLPPLQNLGLLTSGKLAYGWVRADEGRQVDVEAFDKMVDKHQITPGERDAMWPGAKKLWCYDIRDYIPMEKPVGIRVDGGDKEYVRNVELGEGTLMPRDWNLPKLSDTDMIKLHAQVHEDAAAWMEAEEKAPHEGLINRHLIVMEDMKRRGLEHRILTELDYSTQRFLSRAGGDTTEKRIKLGDLQNLWQEDIVLRRPFLSFTGSAAVNGWGEDIDIHVNHPSYDGKMLDAIQNRLISAIPPAWREKIKVMAEQGGPDATYMPFCDLVLRFRAPTDRKALKMSVGALREARQASDSALKQAEQSRRTNTVVPGRFFQQPVPGSETKWEKIQAWAMGLK